MWRSIPDIETSSPEKIRRFQEEQLKQQLTYLERHSPFYKEQFQKKDIDIQSITTLGDLSQLPFTTKDDLQNEANQFLCVSPSAITDYVTTSGTLGEPVVFAMTEKDLDRLAYNEFRSLACAGGTSDDIYQLMVTLDKRFMAGMAYWLGARKLGAGVIRTGVGSMAFQLDTIRRFRPSILVAVPSFIVKLLDFAAQNGLDLTTSGVGSILCIGEPIRNADFTLNALGRRITENWNVQLFSTYASTEMCTAFTECGEGKGGHHQPELIIVEVLDEEGKLVSEGAAGEVTVTTLGVEAMPLLRFRTGDICHYYSEKCSCGRTTVRLGPVIGRRQQMIKLKGTTLYPPAIFELLDNMKQVDDYIVTVYLNELGLDEVEVGFVAKDNSEAVFELIKEEFQRKVRVIPKLKFVSREELSKLKFPPLSRKAVKLIDKR